MRPLVFDNVNNSAVAKSGFDAFPLLPQKVFVVLHQTTDKEEVKWKLRSLKYSASAVLFPVVVL